MKSNYKRPEKQHTVGAILLGTLAASVITMIKMPEVIDAIVSKVYGPTINIKPDEWEETPVDQDAPCDDTADCEADAECGAADDSADAPCEQAAVEEAVIPEEE